MTNEEAIFDLEQFSFSPIGDGDLHMESIELALSALREQAERNKGCDFCAADYVIMSGSRMTIDGMHKGCTAKFCPNCGKRLEAQHE